MGLPVLGICFGAQLLAVALGGAVTRDAEPEVGINVVRLTHEGRHDGVLGALKREFPVLEFHAEITSELAALIADQLPTRSLDRAGVEAASRSGGMLLDRVLAL